MRTNHPTYNYGLRRQDGPSPLQERMSAFQRALADAAADARVRKGVSKRAPAFGINSNPFQDGPAPNTNLGGIARDEINPGFLGTPAFQRGPEMNVAYSKGRKARTVAEVIAAEAGGKTKAERRREMEHIASVIANRAQQLGISPEAVVASGEFDAYGKTMPPGTQAYRPMAETAFSKIQTKGPVTSATYYATPAKAKNLPSSKSKVAQTASHIFYDGPLKSKVDVAETPQQVDRLSRRQLPGGLLGPKAAPALADNAFAGRFAAQPPGLLGKPADAYSVGGVDVAESPEAIDRMSRAQMADASMAGLTPSAPPSITPNMAQATPAQRMGPTSGLPGLSDYDRSLAAQASAKFDPSAVKASGLARLGPPSADVASSIPGGIGARPGMVTDEKGTYADAFGNTKPGGIMAAASAPKFQQSLAQEQSPAAPVNISPAPQPEQSTAMAAAPAQAAPDANAGWEARHPVNTAFDDQYAVAQAPDLAAPTDVPDYNVADVPETAPQAPDEPTIGDYPAAPEQSFTERNPKLTKAVKDIAVGGLLGGPVGAAIGGVGGLLGNRLGPGFDAAVPEADRFSVGSGLPGIRGALGGARGATANSLSNPGMSVTSLGNGQSLRRSDQYGWTEVVDPSGAVVGIRYDNPEKKGLLGKMNSKVGGLLGGRGGRSVSPGAQRSIDAGRGGLY